MTRRKQSRPDPVAEVLAVAQHPDAPPPHLLAAGITPDLRDGASAQILEFCAGLDESDTDNAARLAAWYPGDLLVMAQQGGRELAWLAWAGTHWEMERGAALAHALAQTLGDRIMLEAALLQPLPHEQEVLDKVEEFRKAGTPVPAALLEDAEAAKKALAKRRARRHAFGLSSKNAGRLAAMLTCRAPHVMRGADEFNADPMKLATPSGTLIFRRERKVADNPAFADPDVAAEDVPAQVVTVKARADFLRGHDRADLITQVLPVDRAAGAKAPRWAALLDEFMPDAGTRRTLQQSLGLGLLGVSPQRLFFHYGAGANGKSVVLETVGRVLGQLSTILPATSLFGQRAAGGASPDIVGLYGKRLVRVPEVPKDEALDESLVKLLTGGEAIKVRPMFTGYFEFKPVFTAHLSGNAFPRVAGNDEGIWRRLVVLKWPITIPEDRRREFEEVVGELMEEAPGILEWLIAGAVDWLENGLVISADAREQSAAWRVNANPLAAFLDECVEATGDSADRIATVMLAEHYQAWCASEAREPMKSNTFTKMLAERIEGFNATFPPGSGRKVRKQDAPHKHWVGLKMKREPQRPQGDGPGGGGNWEREM